MIFHTLHAENFMRFESVDLPLKAQGLTLILGETPDTTKASSNGAGKSALLDALCWGLWGQTVRGLRYDDVVREDAGKDCKVVVEFEDSGVLYRVERYRKHTKVDKPNDLRFYIDGKPDDGASVSATQDRINDALGLDFHTFQCMMPGAGVKVAELTDTKIKELLEKLLQTEQMAKARQVAKDAYASVSEDLALRIAAKESLERDIQSCEQQLQRYTELRDTFEEAKAKKLRDLQDTLARVELRIVEHTKALNTLNEVQDELSEKGKAYDRLKSENQVLEAGIWHVENSSLYDKVREEYLDADRTVAHYRKMFFDKQDQLIDRDVCPTCERVLDPAHIRRLLKERGSLYDEALIAAKTAKHKEHMIRTAISTVYADITKVQTKLHQDIAKLKYELRDLYSAVERLPTVRAEIYNLKQRKVSLLEAIEEKKQETSPYDPLIQDELTKAPNLAAEWAKVAKEVKELSAKKDAAAFWVRGFSAKGLRNHMLRSITPILNASAKRYCELLTDGEMIVEFSAERKLKNGKTKEEFSIQVNHADGASSYVGSSTGERGRADLVIAFAIGDLAQLRAKKRIPFRFLDEPFESIDDAGHEAILALLHAQDYDTVYCITHKHAFQQLFPRSIKVVKKNGVSKVIQND